MAREFAIFTKDAGNRAGSPLVRRLELVTPRLHELGVDVQEEDLLHPRVSSGRWDVIRAANILNRAYFGADELRTMLGGLLGSLEVGGLLAVCRTAADGLNHGSVWRTRSDGGLDLVGRVGVGSEVDELLAGCVADRDRVDLSAVLERRCDAGAPQQAADHTP